MSQNKTGYTKFFEQYSNNELKNAARLATLIVEINYYGEISLPDNIEDQVYLLLKEVKLKGVDFKEEFVFDKLISNMGELIKKGGYLGAIETLN